MQILAEDEDTGADDCLIVKVFEDVIPPMTQMGIELQHPVSLKNRLESLIEGIPTLIT